MLKQAEALSIRSPERGALAAEISVKVDLEHYIAAARRAWEDADRSTRHAAGRCNAAEEMLEELGSPTAKERALDAAMGLADPLTQGRLDIAEELLSANAALEEARMLRDGLKERLDRAERQLARQLEKVKKAAGEVLFRSPAVAALLDRTNRLQRELADAAIQLEFLKSHGSLGLATTPVGIPYFDRTPGLARDVTNRLTSPPANWVAKLQGTGPGAAPWAAVLEALLVDPDAAIPS